jgi:hypothetical protein
MRHGSRKLLTLVNLADPCRGLPALISKGGLARMIDWEAMHFEQVKAMPDEDLLLAYQRTAGEPGNQTADGLLAEIKRRNLAI